MHSNSTKRRIVTLSDGNAAIEVKLWGELVDSIVAVGSTVVVTCVHVDIYQEKHSLNSSVSTEVKVLLMVIDNTFFLALKFIYKESFCKKR